MTESLHALSGAYVVDALDDHERAQFERHLPGCLDCQQEVASLREAAALLADDAALTPPASLRASVLSGITAIRPLPPEVGPPAAEEETEAERPVAAVLPLRPRRARLLSMAAAAAVAAVIGVTAVAQPWQDDSPPVAGPLRPADRVLAAPDAKHVNIEFTDGSSATLVRSLKEGRAVLVTRGMAAPPKGKVFELWMRDAEGNLIADKLMTKAGDNKILLQGDMTKATGVGITVEPEGGSTTPTTKPIAMFDFAKAEA